MIFISITYALLETDFDDGRINYETCHYVEQGRYDQDPHIQIHDGSILITKDGTLGKVAYVQGLTMPATLNAGVFNVEIEDEDNTDGKYLFQFLKAPFLISKQFYKSLFLFCRQICNIIRSRSKGSYSVKR